MATKRHVTGNPSWFITDLDKGQKVSHSHVVSTHTPLPPFRHMAQQIGGNTEEKKLHQLQRKQTRQRCITLGMACFFLHRHRPPPSHGLWRYILPVQRDEKATSGSSNFFVSSFLFDALQSKVGAKKGSESHGTQLIEPSSQNQHLGKPTSYHQERIPKKRTLNICIHMVKRDLCVHFVSFTSDTTGS